MQPSSLKALLKGKVVIVGIGNPLRGDDGFGPALVNELQGKTKALCLDVGQAPENYTGKIIKENPDTIILVDALHMKKHPGSVEIILKDEITKSGMSTHDISPHMFIEYLEKNTHAAIYLLGVEPKTMEFGAEISDEVKSTIGQLCAKFIEVENA